MAERPLNDRHSIVGRLYDQHGASLYRYALMLLADPAAAADAVQQVFTALLRPAATIAFDNEAHYLRRAVRNECFSTRRRQRVRDDEAGLARYTARHEQRRSCEPVVLPPVPRPDVARRGAQ